MAQLNSPGVSVTVTDESFYTPNAPGTVPLIFIATSANKMNGAGTSTAPGTLQANAGQVYLLTSQKDVSDTFGMPIFQTDAENNPINAGELNEYGLQAAYSYLGVNNRAYVVRADVDLSELTGSATVPSGAPADGTYWFDSTDSLYGVFVWNSNPAPSGQTFTNIVPTVITNSSYVDSNYVPLSSYGSVGQYAIVAVTNLIKLWYKKSLTNTAAGTWVEVGSPTWAASMPSARGTTTPSGLSGSNSFTITVNGTAYTHPSCASLSDLQTAINSTNPAPGITAFVVNNALEIYSTGTDFTLSGSNVTAAGFQQTTYKAPALQMSPHTSVPVFDTADWPGTANGRPSGSIWVKTTNPNLGASWVVEKYSAAVGNWIAQSAPLYANNAAAIYALDPTGGGANIPAGTIYVKYDDAETSPQYADFKIYLRTVTGPTVITSMAIGNSTFTSGINTFTIAETTTGSNAFTSPVTVTFTATGSSADAGVLLSALQAALLSTNITATSNALNQIIITHTTGGDIKLVDGTNTPITNLFPVLTTNHLFNDPASQSSGHYVASLWSSTLGGTGFAPAAATAPATAPANGTLWYNTVIGDVDIMINDGTGHWRGYLNYSGTAGTNPLGPTVSATAPTAPNDQDLWINTSSLDHYPVIYRWSASASQWVLINNTDHTTNQGIIFADARWATSGAASSASTIVQLLSSDYLDPDAPNAALYPRGMLLWNLRRSGYNVKKYVRNYINRLAANTNNGNESMLNYFLNRWVSDAPNHLDGSGAFGRYSQRSVVVTSLASLINTNLQIRDEDSRVFNLIAAPGYPELMSELVGLNTDRGLTAFVVGDSPARLPSDATSLANWGNNVNNAAVDGEKGLVTTSPDLGVFYPWGYTTDYLGNNIVVPPSHMMLRTISISDNVSYPWFAPAGTQRGGITNASNVGYVDSQGEFVAIALNTGQRDTLASVHVNPITYITGTGLKVMGQYTRQLTATALDRINVARLVEYLRFQLAIIAKSYLFEPNDKITRQEISKQIQSFLLELVGQRALYDYIVVCDSTNNPPSVIDASELYVDIAIEPVKAVEFIYIPLRIQNTGTIKNLASQ